MNNLDNFLVIIFVTAIRGAGRESRPMVLTTGSLTLALLLMAVFSHQFPTTDLFLLLAIVMLSFAFSALIQERQLYRQTQELRARLRLQTQVLAHNLVENSRPFTSVVIQSPPQNSTQSDGQSVIVNKDLPPPYEDCRPPKYEDVANVDTN